MRAKVMDSGGPWDALDRPGFMMRSLLENPATNLAPGIPDTVNGLAVNVTSTSTGGFPQRRARQASR